MSSLLTLRGARRTWAALLLTLMAIVLTGCTERLSIDGVPGVPPGFGERMPDVPLSGYIFVTPPGDGETIKLNAILRGEDGSNVPWQAEARSISLWLSPVSDDEDLVTTTIRFTFGNEFDAITATDVFANVDAGATTWVHSNEYDTELVIGSLSGVETMREILDENRYVGVERLPRTGMWRNALSLPQAPPRPVIAAGFVQLPPERISDVFEWLAGQGIIDLTLFGEMLETLEIDNAVFALYGDEMPPLSTDSTLSELTTGGLTGLAIARTGIPAPLVSWGFNVGALRAGMDRVDTTYGRYYRYEGEGAVVLAQVRRGDIQLAAAADPVDAAQILELIPN